VGDVLHENGRVRRRIALRTFKRSSTEPATQEVFIPDSLWYKLGKLVSWKRGQGESLVRARIDLTSDSADVRYIQEMLSHVELITTQIYTQVSSARSRRSTRSRARARSLTGGGRRGRNRCQRCGRERQRARAPSRPWRPT
jgi:hypothetical protein